MRILRPVDGLGSAEPSLRPPRAKAVEKVLLTPAPTSLYLLAALCQPRAERREQLERAAAWFELERVLADLDPQLNRQPIEQRWLRLLERAATELERGEGQQLTALITVLERAGALVDDGAKVPRLDRLWQRVSQELEANPEWSHRGMQPMTLRGRWTRLRGHLAEVLASMAAQASPASLLPREARTPLMFEPASFKLISTALRADRGFVVIDADPGSGRNELAIAYAHKFHARDYDRVFVLRATDRLRLEQDFLEMAALIVGGGHDRARLRREALAYLETHDRWLMVFLSVSDPALLLPIIPWRENRGNILCTAEPQRGERDPWGEYYGVTPTPIAAFTPVDAASPGEAGSGPTFDGRRYLVDAVSAGAAETEAFAAVASAVGHSRYATALAIAWLRYTRDAWIGPEADRDGRQLAAYAESWARQSPEEQQRSTETRAALIQLQELDRTQGAKGRRRSKEDEQVEADALQLVARLSPFVTPGMPIATFQAVLLDHPAYVVSDRIEDRRLRCLAELALADPHDASAARKSFHINPSVLEAASAFQANPEERHQAQADAARTLVRLLTRRQPMRGIPDVAFELLPHIEAMAKLESAETASGDRPPRPLLAAELFAYGALSHLERNRVRDGLRLLEEVKRIVEDVKDRYPGLPIDDEMLEDWQDLSEDPSLDRALRPEPLAKRLGKLIRAMRYGGFPGAAADVFGWIEPFLDSKRPLRDPANTERLVARLRFEAGMVFHDLDNLEAAETQLDQSLEVASDLDAACRTMIEGLQAEILLDRGEHRLAREKVRRVGEVRRLELDAAPGQDRQAWLGDVARSDYLEGRIAYVRGHLVEAHELFQSSVERWHEVLDSDAEAGREHYSPLNQIVVRSYAALLDALLGRPLRASEEADAILYDLETTFYRPHAGAIVRTNVAQVYRIAGRVGDAVRVHRKAAEDAERGWRPGHRIERLVRRQLADSLLDDGQSDLALDLLLGLLDRPEREAAESETHGLDTPRVLGSLGRLLVEHSLSPGPLKPKPSDDVYIDLAERVLVIAQGLFASNTDEPGAQNPGALACMLSRAEIGLRLRDHATARAFAEQAVELAEAQYAGAVGEVLARARLLRARALDPDIDEEGLDDLELELERLDSPAVQKPLDDFELALARLDIDVRRVEIGIQRDGLTLSEVEAKALLNDARQSLLKPLEHLEPSLGASRPHQAVARVYAELAAAAQRVGAAAQLGSRNARERDRRRPQLGIEPTALSYRVGAAMDRVTHQGAESVS